MNKDLTPKQFIKYTKWLDKHGLAICDGSTLEPVTLGELFNNFLILFGILGGAYVIWKLPHILIARYKDKKERKK